MGKPDIWARMETGQRGLKVRSSTIELATRARAETPWT